MSSEAINQSNWPMHAKTNSSPEPDIDFKLIFVDNHNNYSNLSKQKQKKKQQQAQHQFQNQAVRQKDKLVQRHFSLAFSKTDRSPDYYPYIRVSLLRTSADLESRGKYQGGVTPPYCPSGPTLSRHYIFEDEAYGDRPEIFAVGRRYEPSWLSVDPWSAALSSSTSPTVTTTSVRLAKVQPETMPHAVPMPQTGFQALILCGPGGSLNTFTTVPSEYPKALITLANRPMVWYVLDWCYRMGVTSESAFSTISFQPAKPNPPRLCCAISLFWEQFLHLQCGLDNKLSFIHTVTALISMHSSLDFSETQINAITNSRHNPNHTTRITSHPLCRFSTKPTFNLPPITIPYHPRPRRSNS